jgi:hypothetical protein
MVSPTRRLARRLGGGLLVGAMGAILWAARRGQAPPTAQPAPATSSPASVESQGSQLLAKPTSALSRARSNVSWLLGVAVSIGFAGGGAGLWPEPDRPGRPRRSGSGRGSSDGPPSWLAHSFRGAGC